MLLFSPHLGCKKKTNNKNVWPFKPQTSKSKPGLLSRSEVTAERWGTQKPDSFKIKASLDVLPCWLEVWPCGGKYKNVCVCGGAMIIRSWSLDFWILTSSEAAAVGHCTESEPPARSLVLSGDKHKRSLLNKFGFVMRSKPQTLIL